MKYTIKSGSVKETVEAESVEAAAVAVFQNAPEGAELGLLIRVEEHGGESEEYWMSTEKLLRAHGMWTEQPKGTVSLHAIYCDCERCKPKQ